MDTPKLINPLEIPSNAITEQEFLGIQGVGDIVSGFVLDKIKGNRALKTQRCSTKFHKDSEKANREYYEAREKAKEIYQLLVKNGVIRDKTPIEKTITKAHGHPDNQSTQAARRMLYKRGIDWKTGKKL